MSKPSSFRATSAETPRRRYDLAPDWLGTPAGPADAEAEVRVPRRRGAAWAMKRQKFEGEALAEADVPARPRLAVRLFSPEARVRGIRRLLSRLEAASARAQALADERRAAERMQEEIVAQAEAALAAATPLSREPLRSRLDAERNMLDTMRVMNMRASRIARREAPHLEAERLRWRQRLAEELGQTARPTES